MRPAPLATLLALCLVQGCASRGQTQNITLRVSNWGGAGNGGDFDRMVQGFYRQFELDNPGVTVSVETVPEAYPSKMMLDYVAGAMPDVMTVDASSAAVFVDNGILEDLRPYIAQERNHPDQYRFSLDNFYKSAVDIDRRADRIYAIPGDFTPMVLYYNKDLFDRAHVPYPKPGWTFADFQRTARLLTVPGKQYGFFFKNWMPGWIMWLWNGGGDVLSKDNHAEGVFDSPQNVKTVTFLRGLVSQGLAPALSQQEAQGQDLFAAGKCAMTISGHWSLIDYKNPPKDAQGNPDIDWQHLGVVELPHDAPNSQTVMYEAGLAIPTQAKHKQLAWKFIKAWTSYQWQMKYQSSGIAVCARKDVAEQRATTPIEKEFLGLIPQARPPYGSFVQGYDAVETLGTAAMDSILNDNVPVAQSLKSAAYRIDREFAK